MGVRGAQRAPAGVLHPSPLWFSEPGVVLAQTGEEPTLRTVSVFRAQRTG